MCAMVGLRRFAMAIVALIVSLGIGAQELEYKMELGGMLGGSFYLGDANYSSFYKNTGLGGGLMGRYTVLDDNAFYPFILRIDNVIEKVKEIRN